MNSTSTWQRVSKRQPCPICSKPDWCMFAGPEDSPEAVICARIESATRCGEAGWLHHLRNDGPTWSPRVHKIELSAARIGAEKTTDFAKLAADFRAAVRPENLDTLAMALGVSAESLTRLGVGWSAKHSAWTFPMKDAGGEVVGIRLRKPNGKKLSVRGSKEGLFIPDGIGEQNTLLVCEGPTDCAALFDLGFSAIGRPSCMGGTKLIVNLIRKVNLHQVVIVADADAPGQRGAKNLAAVLVAYCQAVRIVSPPQRIKDAREWKRRGATATDVQATIDAAPVRKLRVSICKRKAGHRGKRK